jgi:hypothetical protein
MLHGIDVMDLFFTLPLQPCYLTMIHFIHEKACIHDPA